MQRFFVEPYQIEEEEHRIHINGTDVNHIKNVLRMKCGEDVWISDGGNKEYHCQIEELGEDEVLLHILYAQEPEYELSNKIYLFQGLPKADKMELIIQKAVELGAAGVIPVATRNAVVKLDAKKAEAKIRRWQAIAESAAKQSKRSYIPQVGPVMSLKEAFSYIEEQKFDLSMIPYELEKGSAEAIHQKWKEICVDSLVNPKTKWHYADVCRGIVADFDALPIDETLRKPRVGIVGEILVKYMPLANNHLVELLEAEGAEAVVPDLLDFFNYSIYGRDFRHKNLGTSWKDSVVAKAGVEMLRRLRAPALEALEKSRRFEAPMPIEDVAKLAEPFLAIGNQYGEGWFLTGEMAELLTSGTPNIVCIQPFACLPNHVVGKGVIKALRKSYPWANIVAVDYDPGASEVNQLNRIKLMLSSARRAMQGGAAQDAEALPIAR